MALPYMAQPAAAPAAQPAAATDPIQQLLAMFQPQSLAGTVNPNQPVTQMTDPSQQPAAANPASASGGGDLSKIGDLASSIGTLFGFL